MPDSKYCDRVSQGQSELWRGRPRVLDALEMELTERCNNNCVHCYINLPATDDDTKGRELSTESAAGILRDAAALGCLQVRFTGGEPLLREDFPELYLVARRLGLRVLLSTNATLINPQLATLLHRFPPLESIDVSLYGMTRESYEVVSRVSGSFEAAWRGVNLLLENRVRFVPRSVALPSIRPEMDEFEAWAKTVPGMEYAPGYTMLLDLRCRRDSAQKDRMIRTLRLQPDDVVTVGMRREEEYLRGMKQFCAAFIGPGGERLLTCGAGVRGGCVDAYGRFQPCLSLRHPATSYNLSGGSLEDALKSFFPRIRTIKAENPDYLARCARCFIKGLCEQCPGKSWMEHGTLDTPVRYLCEVAHAQARHLGLLRDGENAWQVVDWQQRVAALRLQAAAT